MKKPLVAHLGDLEDCLKLLGNHPLKLIAEAAQPSLGESFWTEPRWAFHAEGNSVTDKPLLALTEDSFQFSLANERSNQDFHFHARVLEIYVSNSRIEITYLAGGKEEDLALDRGVLIVPPGLPHKVKLHGLTFVFQAAMNGGQVHNDKVLVEHASG